MKAVVQYDRKSAARQFRLMLDQWQTNAIELSRHCRSNPKVQEMCQSLTEAASSIEEWADLPGSIFLVCAYQPGLFDQEEFDERAKFDLD